MPKKGNVPDVQKKREEWAKELAEIPEENLVYLDESGVNTDMTRLYGRAKSNARVVDKVPLSTPKTTTVLSSIRKDGEKIFTSYPGGTTTERFKEYLEEKLIPSLRKDDVVVMDNMRTHHAKVITKLLEERHIQYRYLPPYSPDMNPIEKMWSKMKAGLRKIKVRSSELLPQAIQTALDAVSAEDCSAWFV